MNTPAPGPQGLHPLFQQIVCAHGAPAPSPKLSPDQMHSVLTDWHAQNLNEPLYNHMQTSFEDMADQLWAAIKNEKAAQEEAAWSEREDMPGFAGTYARLGALTLQGVSA